MSLDTTALAAQMIEAARKAVSRRWPALRTFAELELGRLAQALAEVATMLQEGRIDRSKAQKLVRMYQNAAAGVLATVQGFGLLTAGRAVAAATSAAAAVINHLAGFKLLDPPTAFKAGKDL